MAISTTAEAVSPATWAADGSSAEQTTAMIPMTVRTPRARWSRNNRVARHVTTTAPT